MKENNGLTENNSDDPSKGSAPSTITEVCLDYQLEYLRQRCFKQRLRLLGAGASKVVAPQMTERINSDRSLGNDEAKAQPSVANDHWQLLTGDKVSRESDPSPGSLNSMLHKYDNGTCFKQRLGLHSDGASKGSASLTIKGGMTNTNHQLALVPPMTNEFCLESPLGYNEAKAQPSVADDHRQTSDCLGLHSNGASKGLAPSTITEVCSDCQLKHLRRRCLKQRLHLQGEGASKVLAPQTTERIISDRPLGNDEAKAQPSVANDHWQLLTGDKVSRESDPSPGSLNSMLHKYDNGTCFKQRLGLHSDGASKGSASLTIKGGMTNTNHQLALVPPMTNEFCLESPLGYNEAKAQPSVADDHRQTSDCLGLHSNGASKGLAPSTVTEVCSDYQLEHLRQCCLKQRLRLPG